jgi:hypothetical protein
MPRPRKYTEETYNRMVRMTDNDWQKLQDVALGMGLESRTDLLVGIARKTIPAGTLTSVEKNLVTKVILGKS